MFFDRVIARRRGQIIPQQLGDLVAREARTNESFLLLSLVLPYLRSLLSLSLSLVRICAERILEIADEKRDRFASERKLTVTIVHAENLYSKKIARYRTLSSIFDRVKPGRTEPVTSSSNMYRYYLPRAFASDN